MQIEHFIRRLERLSALNSIFRYNLGSPLIINDFKRIEKKLNINIPNKIKDFYLIANGLITMNPSLEIIELDKWILDSGLIHFATFNEAINIYFKTSELNDAQEWTIFNKNDNYDITLTINSFWSNKIWHWLEQKHIIWKDQFWEE
jgi:hypothetical protein